MSSLRDAAMLLVVMGASLTTSTAAADDPCALDAERLRSVLEVERVGALPPVPEETVLEVGECEAGRLTLRVRLPDGREAARSIALTVHPQIRERFVAALLVELAQRTLSEPVPATSEPDVPAAASNPTVEVSSIDPRADRRAADALDEPMDDAPESASGTDEPIVSATLQAGILAFLRGPSAVPNARAVFGLYFLRLGMDFSAWEHPHALGTVETVLWTGRLGARLYTWGDEVRFGVDLYAILGAGSVRGMSPIESSVPTDGGVDIVGGGSAVATVTHRIGVFVFGARLEAGWLVGLEAVDGPVIDGPFVDLSLLAGLAG